MKNSFRLVVAQLNPRAGDLEGNAKKVRLVFQEAKEMNANLVASSFAVRRVVKYTKKYYR